MRERSQMAQVTIFLFVFCIILVFSVIFLRPLLSKLMEVCFFVATRLFTAPGLFWAVFLAVGVFWISCAVIFWRHIRRGVVDGPALSLTHEYWHNLRREVGKQFSFVERNLRKKMKNMKFDGTSGGNFPDDVS